MPIVVYGAPWCADCHQVRSLLDSYGATYAYHDIDAEPDAKAEMLAKTGGRNVIPTIVWDNGVIQEPSNNELIAALGLKGVPHGPADSQA